MPQMSGDQLVAKLKQIASHVPMVLLGDPQKMNGQIHGADALLAKKTCSPQELLERVKLMSARKRGPRKGVQRLIGRGAGSRVVAPARGTGQGPDGNRLTQRTELDAGLRGEVVSAAIDGPCLRSRVFS